MSRLPRRTAPLRTATALAASLSLLVPSLSTPLLAQSEQGEEGSCTERFSDDADGLAACLDEIEVEPEAAEEPAAGAEAAAVEEQATEDAQAEADAPAAAEENAAPAETAAEETPATAEPLEESEALEALEDPGAPVNVESEPIGEESAVEDETLEVETDAPLAIEDSAEEGAELLEEEEAEAEAAETATPQTATPETATPEAEGAGDAEAIGTETEATEGAVQGEEQSILLNDEASLAAAEDPVVDETPLVETETESAAADEVAARAAPELTEEQEVARAQAEQALATLDVSDGEPFAATAAAAAAEEGAADGATVEEETIAAGDTRSSSEDFATSALVSDAPAARSDDDDDDDDDDSGFDRNDGLLLGALGALAVGVVLNNRSRVVSNSGDRVVVQRDDGNLQVLKDDDVLLRQPGSNVRTERFDDGSSRQTVLREDGSSVVTIRDASLRVLRRELIQADGSRFTLIDDTTQVAPVDLATLPSPSFSTRAAGDDPLAAAIRREQGIDRRFSLAQVRNIAEVRALAPAFDVSTVTFDSGSAAIAPEQAGNLTGLAREVLAAIRANPREVFLIEGHTDATGDAALNLALSDRRAESLALALNEYFEVPVENMVVQGYGERFLKVQTQESEQANRRASVRQITGLLQTAAAN